MAERAGAPRIVSTWCHRPFSWPEAAFFELAVADAVADALVAHLLGALGVALRPGARVLDVGGGGGTLAARLSALRAVRVLAVDPSAAQERRVASVARRTELVAGARGTAEALPVLDAAFDAVVSSCALKHWSDPARGIAECVRATAPAGRCAIIELDGACGADTFDRFAATTRVPAALRSAYAAFTMRTAVRAAPDLAAFAEILGSSDAAVLEVRRLEGLPFLLGVLAPAGQP